jgi:alanyl-tRNA synthetase
MSEAVDILAKIKLQKQENDELNMNIQKLTNEEKILQEKLERLERQNQEKIDEYEDKKKSLENIKPSSNKDNENDAERREKELDDFLRSKLLELILGSERKDRPGLDLEKRLNKVMTIGSVMIRYLPLVEDGDIEAFEKTDPLEAYFKINKKTTFNELKETACEFWVLFI